MIARAIKNLFMDGELDEKRVSAKNAHTGPVSGSANIRPAFNGPLGNDEALIPVLIAVSGVSFSYFFVILKKEKWMTRFY